MEIIVAIVAIIVAYHLGRFNLLKKQEKQHQQWHEDAYDETPIGTQLAREMGLKEYMKP